MWKFYRKIDENNYEVSNGARNILAYVIANSYCKQFNDVSDAFVAFLLHMLFIALSSYM